MFKLIQSFTSKGESTVIRDFLCICTWKVHESERETFTKA